MPTWEDGRGGGGDGVGVASGASFAAFVADLARGGPVGTQGQAVVPQQDHPQLTVNPSLGRDQNHPPQKITLCYVRAIFVL